MTLVDLLPILLLYVTDLLSARITAHPTPPAPLLTHGLMEESGRLTSKGMAFTVRLYGMADVLDVAVA